ETVHDLTRINYLGYATIAHLAIPHMVASGQEEAASIIAVESLAGCVPIMRVNSYGASKAAGRHYFNCMGKELRAVQKKEGKRKTFPRVTVVNLGSVATETVLETFGKNSFEWFLSKSPAQTADAIVRAGMMGKWEVYFPGYMGWLHVV